MLEKIMDIDIGFAINAARFVEEQSDELIEIMLRALMADGGRIAGRLGNARFELLQFSTKHELLLRRLASEVPSLRSAAVHALARILGQPYKSELIEMLFGTEYGWEVRQSVRALNSLLGTSDIVSLIDRALQWDSASFRG